MKNENLRKRRIELGLTQEEVAKKVGVTIATISRWETSDISNMKRDKISLLADALQVSPLYILDCSDNINTGTNNGIIGNSNSNNNIFVQNRDLPPIQSAILTTISYLSFKDQCDVLEYATSLLYKNKDKEEDK